MRPKSYATIGSENNLVLHTIIETLFEFGKFMNVTICCLFQ